MKRFICVLALICLAASHKVEITSDNGAVDEVFGFLEGLVSTAFNKSLPDITPCLTDSQAEVDDLAAMIADFKQGKSGIVAGLEKLGAMLTTLSPLISSCKQCPAEIKAGFATLKTDFTSPSTIAKMLLHAIEHIGTVVSDVKLVVSDFEAKNYIQMGSDLGKVIAILEVESELMDVHSIVKDMSLLIKGLFTEAFQKEIPDLDDCVTDAETIEADVKAIVSDFTHKKFVDGFKAISALVEKVAPALADCKKVVPEVKTEVTSLVSHIKDIKRDEKILLDVVLHHLEELLQDVIAVKTDFTSHNYFQMGTDLGKILILLQLP
jgi:hypothetical protein